jgi:hypothetical protein
MRKTRELISVHLLSVSTYIYWGRVYVRNNKILSLFPVYKFLPFSAGNHLFCIIFDEEKGGVWRYLVRYCMEYYP